MVFGSAAPPNTAIATRAISAFGYHPNHRMPVTQITKVKI